ncbi:MAG: hypothetical protein V1660_01990 [archaeon]
MNENLGLDGKLVEISRYGRLGITTNRNEKNQKIGVMDNIGLFNDSNAKELLLKLEENGQVIKYKEIHPTIERLIETFLVFYTFADKRPDGNLEEVITDVCLDKDALNWLEGMFKHYQKPFPKIRAKIENPERIKDYKKTKNSLVTLSGGKDSSYIALESEAVPIHIAKINRFAQTRELNAVLRLTPNLPKKPFVLPLYNSLILGHGSKRCEIRDALIYTLMLPFAHKTGATKIYSGAYEEEDWYSDTPKGLSSLNELFSKKGIEVSVIPIKKMSERELIRNFIRDYPEIFELTSPCISSDDRHTQNRNWFKSKFPFFPLFDGICGVCPKDVQLNMARLLYDPKVVCLPYQSKKDVAEYYLNRIRSSKEVDRFVEDGLIKRISLRFQRV